MYTWMVDAFTTDAVVLTEMLNGLAFVTLYKRKLTNVSKSAARTRCIPVSTLVRVRKLLTSNITVNESQRRRKSGGAGEFDHLIRMLQAGEQN